MNFKGKFPIVNIILFLATIYTTMLAGGVLFSISIMLILLSHEMGHYILAKKHNIDVTLPYFIPFPNIIGTMGAVITMKSGMTDRNKLMDVGAAGPIAGFIVTIIIMTIGLCIAEPAMPQPAGTTAITLGESLVYKLLTVLTCAPENIHTNAMMFAGWVGMLLTMLNLLPFGSLDGGHVVYALIGKNKSYPMFIKALFLIFLLFALIMCFIAKCPIWMVFFVLIYLIGGPKHPPVENNHIELTPGRKIIGWLCLIIFIITFMPIPIIFG